MMGLELGVGGGSFDGIGMELGTRAMGWTHGKGDWAVRVQEWMLALGIADTNRTIICL